jgi:Na+-driven multidrug efflux pump
MVASGGKIAHSDPKAALLQCTGLSGLAYLICALLGPRPLWAILLDGQSVAWQLAAGSVIGVAFSASTALAILRTGRFKAMNRMKWGYAVFLFLVWLMFAGVLIHIGLMAAVVVNAAADAIIFYVLREVALRP